MKKLYRHIALYLIPVIAFLIFLPTDNKLKYRGLQDDCFNHGSWIYNRIYENNKKIDIAILGSSHTINGIDDNLIEKNLKGYSVANFGYCRLGRNLSYILFKEILRKKNPKYIILEVREDESKYSHPIFPYLAESKDIIFANPFFNKDILKDIWTHFVFKIELLQDYFYSNEPDTSVKMGDFGFSTFSDTAELELLKYCKIKRNKPEKSISNFEYNFNVNFARIYLKKIYNLCKQKDIKIFFLYLPGFGRENQKPKELKTYQEYGEILFPPKDIISNPSHWYDENHLNKAGAKKLSLWLSKQLKTKLN